MGWFSQGKEIPKDNKQLACEVVFGMQAMHPSASFHQTPRIIFHPAPLPQPHPDAYSLFLYLELSRSLSSIAVVLAAIPVAGVLHKVFLISDRMIRKQITGSLDYSRQC